MSQTAAASAVKPRETKETKNNKFLKYTYIFLTMVSCLSIYDIERWTKLKLAHVLFIVIAFLHFFLVFKTDKLKQLWGLVWRYALFLFGLLLISITINIITQSDTAMISQGIIKIAYQFISVFAALCALYLFEDKAVDYTFWGFVLFNTLAIFLSLKEHGISGAIWSIQKFLTTGGDADGFMKRLELHDATFTFGLFLIYYFIKGPKTHMKEFIVCAFFFAIGYKRIGMAAAAVAMFLVVVLRKVNQKNAVTIGKIAMAVFLAAGFGHVVLIRTGIFQEIMDALHIDMMGRQNLFEYIENFYTISPKFAGHGFDSIRIILSRAGDVKVNNTYISRMGAIHSDYLRMYIELGFWGFFFWGWYLFIFMPGQMAKMNFKAFLAYAACTLYLAITYFTDNTAMFFMVTMVYKMIPGEFVISKEKRNVFQTNRKTSQKVSVADSPKAGDSGTAGSLYGLQKHAAAGVHHEGVSDLSGSQ